MFWKSFWKPAVANANSWLNIEIINILLAFIFDYCYTVASGVCYVVETRNFERAF